MTQGGVNIAQTLEELKKACEKCGCVEVCDEDCMLGIANPHVECSRKCSEEEVKKYVDYYTTCDILYGPTEEEPEFEDDYYDEE